jgi:alpha-aminoadipate carrier protein LysW
MAICPECEFEIDIDELDVDKGDTLECDNCGTALEVVSLNPIALEEADQIVEDFGRFLGALAGREGETPS